VAVVSDSPPERNGVGSYYADLTRQLEPVVAGAELLCPAGRHTHWNRYLLPPLPGDRTQKVWLPNPFSLWRRLSRNRPDAIVVPTPGPYGLFGLAAARTLRIPLIIGFHTHYEALTDIYWANPFGRLCRWYLTGCNRLLFRHSVLVLANSAEMRRQAEALGATRVELMGTSVPSEFLQRPLTPARDALRRVLFVGRLAEEKNLPALLAAAGDRPELQFSIVGDGPLRALVERAAAELGNVNYLGWASRSRLVEIIDAHDLLLLSSHVESFGTVALEAMARGRNVLVSPTCGIADWPQLREGLYVMDPGETIAAALQRVAGLPANERRARAARAHELARQLNAWNLESWVSWLHQPGAR
jgi:glycosyltransferase involved in cell wall biosynthesis